MLLEYNLKQATPLLKTKKEKSIENIKNKEDIEKEEFIEKNSY